MLVIGFISYNYQMSSNGRATPSLIQRQRKRKRQGVAVEYRPHQNDNSAQLAGIEGFSSYAPAFSRCGSALSVQAKGGEDENNRTRPPFSVSRDGSGSAVAWTSQEHRTSNIHVIEDVLLLTLYLHRTVSSVD